MGDIAEMMLDGTLCASCGVILQSSFGCPILCRACANEVVKPKESKKVKCPQCNKMVNKRQGLKDHLRVVHTC